MKFMTNKRLAGIVAAYTIAVSLSSTTGNVSALNIAPNSDFTYELVAEVISETEIAVTFQTTYNPGTSEIAIAFSYDPTECTFIKRVSNMEFAQAMLWVGEENTNTGVCVCAATFIPTGSSDETSEYTGPISLTYYFEVENNAALTEDYSFSSNVFSYKSVTENIQESVDLTEIEENEKVIEITQFIPYILGDVNNDASIAINDASKILEIVSSCTNKNESPAVNNINEFIDTNAQYDNTQTWANKHSYLIREGYACTEAADADQNGLIEQEDADDVLEYYSSASANQPTDNLLVGTEFFKPVTITVQA